MADEAIRHMRQIKAIAPDKPFLVYYVPGGTHSPHHPTPEWIKRSATCTCSTAAGTRCARRSSPIRSASAIMPGERQADTRGRRACRMGFALSLDEKKLFIKQADIYAAVSGVYDTRLAA